MTVVLASALVGAGIAASHLAMGKRARNTFWNRVEEATPRIRAKADLLLASLGYDIHDLAAEVYFAGEGEETWTVSYLYPPAKQIPRLHGDLEVYLNKHGEIKRAAKFDQDQEQLIYGKDERISFGMSSAEVLDRLGKPDYKGRPSRSNLRFGDEVWIYKKNAQRTMRIELYFEDGKVTSIQYFG